MVQPYPKQFPPGLYEAAIAASRFGYGARAGELQGIASDPKGWLLVQLEDSAVPADYFQGLPKTSEITAKLVTAQAAGDTALQALRRSRSAESQGEAQIHASYAMATGAPFRERLVRFWCNHFSLSALNPRIFPLTYAFERDVIRPNLRGSFVNLLTEVVRHPAMLLNFENANSIGDYSYAGLKGAAALDDRLAQAILKLYTLGPKRQPTPKDIFSLAKMLTGWSVTGPEEENPGSFIFRPKWHEPNSKYFLEHNFPHAGVLEAEAALDKLGRKEEVATYLATKMAQYFITDTPPSELISSMLRGFTDGANSIMGMAKGMVMSKTAWSPVQNKIKTPEDLVLSTARALGLGGEAGGMTLRAQRVLGQPPKHAPSPEGWSVQSGAWIAPQQMMDRLSWTGAIARRGAMVMPDAPVADTALDILGPLLSPVTYRRIAVAADRGEGLAILFASPEFQRR
ncbi:MAG: DUF1800 family protein [Alphaproteobacteria bacterium]|nr:DUF1800 family protein [Alphaproteobacteria bacterium]